MHYFSSEKCGLALRNGNSSTWGAASNPKAIMRRILKMIIGKEQCDHLRADLFKMIFAYIDLQCKTSR